MITVSEFAELHGVQSVTVRQWIRRGKLRAIKKQGRDWLIADLPTYLHGIDKAAEQIWEVMREKLLKRPEYKKTGEFMHDVKIETEIKNRIDEEILNELIYVD